MYSELSSTITAASRGMVGYVDKEWVYNVCDGVQTYTVKFRDASARTRAPTWLSALSGGLRDQFPFEAVRWCGVSPALSTTMRSHGLWSPNVAGQTISITWTMFPEVKLRTRGVLIRRLSRPQTASQHFPPFTSLSPLDSPWVAGRNTQRSVFFSVIFSVFHSTAFSCTRH